MSKQDVVLDVEHEIGHDAGKERRHPQGEGRDRGHRGADQHGPERQHPHACRERQPHPRDMAVRTPGHPAPKRHQGSRGAAPDDRQVGTGGEGAQPDGSPSDPQGGRDEPRGAVRRGQLRDREPADHQHQPGRQHPRGPGRGPGEGEHGQRRQDHRRDREAVARPTTALGGRRASLRPAGTASGDPPCPGGAGGRGGGAESADRDPAVPIGTTPPAPPAPSATPDSRPAGSLRVRGGVTDVRAEVMRIIEPDSRPAPTTLWSSRTGSPVILTASRSAPGSTSDRTSATSRCSSTTTSSRRGPATTLRQRVSAPPVLVTASLICPLPCRIR